MAHMNKVKSVIAMAGLLGGVALVGVPAFAQTAAPATPPATPDSGMMEHGMPNGQGRMMNPEMMQKMSKMMDNCNHIMESMAQEKGGATAPAAPANKG